MSLWPRKLLIVLLLVITSVHWDGVVGKTMRLMDPAFLHKFEQSNPSLLAFSRESRSPQQRPREIIIRECGQRLLNIIVYTCRSLGQKGATYVARPMKQLPQKHQQQPSPSVVTSDRQRGNIGKRNVQVEDDAFESTGLPSSIRDDCCLKPCNVLNYCHHFKQSEEPKIEMTTTTTTTTTTPKPLTQEQFRTHRFIRPRESGSGSSSWTNSKSFAFTSPVSVQDIREQLIRDAFQCLFDPNCVNMDELILPKHSRLSPKNRKRTTSKPKVDKDQCISKIKRNRTDKGKRLHRMRKEDSEMVPVIPILLRILTWGTQSRSTDPQAHQGVDLSSKKTEEPQVWGHSNPITNPRTGHYETPHAHHHNHPAPQGHISGGGSSSGLPSSHVNNTPDWTSYSQPLGNREILDDYYDDTQSQRYPEVYNPTSSEDSSDDIPEELAMMVVTDPPVRATVGFSRGTYDGISFRP